MKLAPSSSDRSRITSGCFGRHTLCAGGFVYMGKGFDFLALSYRWVVVKVNFRYRKVLHIQLIITINFSEGLHTRNGNYPSIIIVFKALTYTYQAQLYFSWKRGVLLFFLPQITKQKLLSFSRFVQEDSIHFKSPITFSFSSLLQAPSCKNVLGRQTP